MNLKCNEEQQNKESSYGNVVNMNSCYLDDCRSESDRDNENSFRSQNLKGVSIGSGGAFEFEKR